MISVGFVRLSYRNLSFIRTEPIIQHTSKLRYHPKCRLHAFPKSSGTLAISWQDPHQIHLKSPAFLWFSFAFPFPANALLLMVSLFILFLERFINLPDHFKCQEQIYHAPINIQR